jgi:hypothetical protein
MKKLIVMGVSLVLAQNGFADCQDLYSKKIAEISGRMNPPRTTILVNLGAEAVVVTTLAAVGTLSAGAVVALPAAAIAAGGYLGVLSAQRASYQKALLSLKQAEKGRGPIFSKFVKKVRMKNSFADKEQIREALLSLNSENAFCEESLRNGKIKLSKFKHMIKMVSSEI